mgnify:CR=1 FL=1
MKKKLLAVTAAALSAVFAFALAACDDGETTGGSGTHTHTYSEQWSHNDTDHWHACTGADCDEVTDKAAHTWDNGTITAEPTCTAKGEKTYTCKVCSATKTEEIATTEHTFSDKWESDETHHWHKCENCDEISGKAEHAYTDGVCVCGHSKPNTDPMPEFDPIDTLDELYNTPKPDEKDFTEEKYGANYALFYENAVKEYNAAQDMQKAIFNSLDKNVKDKMLYKYFGEDWSEDNLYNVQWELVSNNDNAIIDTIRIFFTYNHSKTMDIYYIESVTPKIQITLEDLTNNNIAYDEAFDTSPRGGAKFSKEYEFSYDPADTINNQDLLTAITAKIGTQLDGNVQSFIKVDGGGTDLILQGQASNFSILNISESGYEEYKISILNSLHNGKTEIENLNNGGYYTHDEKSGTFSGQYLDENSGKDTIDLPAAELFATPAEYKGYAAN